MAAKKTVKNAPAKKVEETKAPTKSVAKKAPAKKAETVKVEVKAPAKKTVAEKAPAKKAVKMQYTPEQVYGMIQEAAYFAAVNDGFQKDPANYWAQAEAEINAKVKA